jgi:RHS repeat-associated protein
VPVAVSRTTGLSYVEADHLGTPRVAANPSTNAKEWGWDLLGKAFGENAATTAVLGKDVRLRYPGQWVDGETGLHYNYFRDYDPQQGRYIESDPIGLYGHISTFGYAASSPANLVDDDGLRPLKPRPAISCGMSGGGGGASYTDIVCDKNDKDCQSRCNCESNVRNVKCLAKPSCILRSREKLHDCLLNCADTGVYKE